MKLSLLWWVAVAEEPPDNALINLFASTPAFSHKVIASATAPIVTPTMIWFASFDTWPLPIGPTKVGLPIIFKVSKAPECAGRVLRVWCLSFPLQA